MPGQSAPAVAAHVDPALLDTSEHIYIGSDEADRDPATAAKTVRAKFELRNRVRRARTLLIVYKEGFLEVVQYRRGKRVAKYRLDLHYLDPAPSIRRTFAARMSWSALGSGGMAVAAALLAGLDVLRAITVPFAIAAAVSSLVVAWLAIYRSHERIEFRTLHGRATVLRLIANFGAIRAARALVPRLARAIEDSAETIGADTLVYLRGEMREHYRLRQDGILSQESCSDSTGRILAQFDTQF